MALEAQTTTVDATETIEQALSQGGQEQAPTGLPEAPKPQPQTPQQKQHILTDAAFKELKEKAAQKYIRDNFGVDDPNIIKEKLRLAEELQAKHDEQRRSEMSEVEKLKEDNQRLLAAKQQVELQAKQAQQKLVVEREVRRLSQIAAKWINPEDIRDVALPKLQKYLTANYTKQQINKLTDADLEKFFRDLAKAKPGIARAAVAAPQNVRKVPVTNGAPNPRPQQKPASAPSRTAKPGQGNATMSHREIEQQYGIKMP